MDGRPSSSAPSGRSGASASSGAPGASASSYRSGAAAPALTREELERVRLRDPDALAVFFDRCFDRVYALARRLTGEDSAAEDVTQDVFLKAHRSARTLDPERDPAPWLAAITYNTCRERWRSRAHRQARRSVPLDEAPGLAGALASNGPTPEADLAARERDARVARAIQELPEQFRTVVVLHEYEGLAHAEIAGMIGAREAAVRKRYSRALGRLRESLGDLVE